MSDIWYSSYELQLKEYPSAPTRKGALIRIDGGVADLHPWPELGDLSIDEELDAIKNNMPTPLGEKSVHFAALDARARANKINLLHGLPKPENHLHLGRPRSSVDLEQLRAEITAHQFRRIKIKVYDFLSAVEFETFKKLARFCGEFEDLKIRLDFNYAFGDRSHDFEDLLSTFSPDELAMVDYFEDPFLFEDYTWARVSEKFKVRLALDRGDQEVKVEDTLRDDKTIAPFAVVVIKPALEMSAPIVESAVKNRRRVVFTSYLDHPIGQLTAAYEAGEHMKVHPQIQECCGLLSQRAYLENDFSKSLLIEGSRLVGAEGTGWGFDALIEKLSWTKLK